MTTDDSKSQQTWRWATRAALHCWLSAMPWCHQWRRPPRNPMRACRWTVPRPGWMRTAWTSSTIGSHRTSQWPMGILVLVWNSVQSTHSVHTHTCMHTHAHMHEHTSMHRQRHTHKHACIHAHMHTRIRVCTHTHMIPSGVCSVVTGSWMNR